MILGVLGLQGALNKESRKALFFIALKVLSAANITAFILKMFGSSIALGTYPYNIGVMGVGVNTISNISRTTGLPDGLSGKSNGCLVIRANWNNSDICTLIVNMDTAEMWTRPTDNAAWHKN